MFWGWGGVNFKKKSPNPFGPGPKFPHFWKASLIVLYENEIVVFDSCCYKGNIISLVATSPQEQENV